MKWESRSSGLSPSRPRSLRPSARAEREGRLDWAAGQKNRRPGLGRGLRVPVPCAARCPAPGAGCARRAGAEGRRLRCGPSRHHVPAPGRVSAPVPLCPRPSRVTATQPAPAPVLLASALGPLRWRRRCREARRGEAREGRRAAWPGCAAAPEVDPEPESGGLGRRGGPPRRREETAVGVRNLAQPGHFSGLALSVSPRERKALGGFGRQRHPVRHRRLQTEGPGSAAGADLRGC